MNSLKHVYSFLNDFTTQILVGIPLSNTQKFRIHGNE